MNGRHEGVPPYRRIRASAAVFLGLVFLIMSSDVDQAQTLTVLHEFEGGQKDGADPVASLVRDSAGNLYGTTVEGGDPACGVVGCGVVFKITPEGKETVIYAFTGGADGATPVAPLIRDSEGNLYGTTEAGGDLSCTGGNGFGCGTVFEIDAPGKEKALYSFRGGNDGSIPEAGLIRDAEGNLYGTTYYGGVSDAGTVFEVTPKGEERLLHTFTGSPDGANPWAAVTIAAGKIFGTTSEGGAYGVGSVFEIEGTTESVFYSFDSLNDEGFNPKGLLVVNGELYGANVSGGSSPCFCGTLFNINLSGDETTLHIFTGPDGVNPEAGLVRDSAGNLYGTTLEGGSYADGTIFELDTSGNLTVLYSFAGGADGGLPRAGLLLDKAGNLYGTTTVAGSYGWGTVFKLAP